MNVDPRYFDYAASSPPWKAAIEAYADSSKINYANPSSIHLHGKNVKQKLLEQKKAFCDLLHFHDGRLLLCSTGSEANNTIIEGHLKKFPDGKLLMAEDVHDSIWYASKYHQKSIKILPIDDQGRLHHEKLEHFLTSGISMVCINHICNETGVTHDIRRIADMCYRNRVKLLVDGMQAVGHVPVDLNEIHCTYYTFSGHKFGAVKGTAGALIRDDEFEPLIHGGRQEWNLRAGTENLSGVASLVSALEISLKLMEKETSRLHELRNGMISRLKQFPKLLINSPESGYPGILSISIPGVSGREMVGAMSMHGFAVSTGSACHASQLEPSRIILAMGQNKQEAIGTVRISMGYGTTSEAMEELLDRFVDAIR